MLQPIGLFDSSLGGLTVLRALREILPNRDVIYIADTAMLPYGERSRANVQRLSYRLVGYLVGQGAIMVVAACNTAVGSLLPEAQEEFQVPILGPILPAAREVLRRGGKRVGILATQGTIQEGYYQRALHDLDQEVECFVSAAPGLVHLVEGGRFSGEDVTGMVQDYLAPFQGKIDTLILGCTHFPFLFSPIQEALAPGIQIIDPAGALAREVADLLEKKGRMDDPGTGTYQFWSTASHRLSSSSLTYLQEELSLPLDFSLLRI